MQMFTHVSIAGILRLCTTHPWKTVGGWLLATGIAVLLIATLLKTAISTQENSPLFPSPRWPRS